MYFKNKYGIINKKVGGIVMKLATTTGDFAAYTKDQFEGNIRLLRVPLEIRIKGEALLYEIGKYILTAYDCFEE